MLGQRLELLRIGDWRDMDLENGRCLRRYFRFDSLKLAQYRAGSFANELHTRKVFDGGVIGLKRVRSAIGIGRVDARAVETGRTKIPCGDSLHLIDFLIFCLPGPLAGTENNEIFD